MAIEIRDKLLLGFGRKISSMRRPLRSPIWIMICGYNYLFALLNPRHFCFNIQFNITRVSIPGFLN